MENNALSKEELIRFIRERRSCRAFTDESVAESDVQAVLDCALSAPSGRGLQTWQFTAVMDRAKIARLCAALGKAADAPKEKAVKGKAVIVK